MTTNETEYRVPVALTIYVTADSLDDLAEQTEGIIGNIAKLVDVEEIVAGTPQPTTGTEMREG